MSDLNKVNLKLVHLRNDADWLNQNELTCTFPRGFLFRLKKQKSLQVKKSTKAGMVLLYTVLKELNLLELLDTYETDIKGKPFFKNQAFYFNLSHSRDFIALAWSYDFPVGVDVQETRKIYPGVIKKIMHEKELSNPRLNDEDFFFECWTKKEAVVKMTGEGISIGLEKIDTSQGEGTYDAHSYCVESFKVGENYFGAIAAPQSFEMQLIS